MKNNILLLFLSILCFQAFSQDSLLVKDIFPIDVQIDQLGNKYRLVRQDSLVKISANPSIIQPYVYSNMRLGEISSFNIQNPLKPIIAHNKLSTLVFTDTTLRETSRLFLPDLEIYSTKLAFAQAYDNSLWIYDDLNAQLVRINEEGAINNNSLSLVELLNRVPTILSMQTNSDYIILEEDQVGFIVLDQFGGYLKTLRSKNYENWKLYGHQLLLLKDNQLIPQEIEGVLLMK